MAVAAEAGGEETRAQPSSVVNWPALGAILCWGAMSPLAKWALDEFPTLAYMAIRPVIAVVMLAAFLLLRGQPLGVERGDLRRFLLAGAICAGSSQFFYIGGLANTSVSHNVILISCSPLLVAGYSLLIKRQKLDNRSTLGVFGGFAGVVLLVAGAAGGDGGASLLGDVLSLGAAVSWMFATILPAPLLAKYGTLRTSLWLLGCSLLTVVPPSLLQIADAFAHPPSTLAWASLVYSGVFGILIGNSLWQHAVHQIGPNRTLIYLYLEPVVALILAALMLGERLSPVQAVGGVLALAGVALVRRT